MISDFEIVKSNTLEYILKMNRWDDKMFHRSRLEGDYEFTREKDLRIAGPQTREELEEEYYKLLEQYCTQKTVIMVDTLIILLRTGDIAE